jgi:hypothetical protein
VTEFASTDKGIIMYATPTLATRFARNTRVLRADIPLTEEQMRAAAPSVFAERKHVSRSERYTYRPTIEVLRGLRKEGFEPFMVAQGASRTEGKAEFTKHLIRVRHVRDRSGQVSTKPEANEIILINSHDGASSYQMLAGLFRFVCCNGLVVGDVVEDLRIRDRLAHRMDRLGRALARASRHLRPDGDRPCCPERVGSDASGALREPSISLCDLALGSAYPWPCLDRRGHEAVASVVACVAKAGLRCGCDENVPTPTWL